MTLRERAVEVRLMVAIKYLLGLCLIVPSLMTLSSVRDALTTLFRLALTSTTSTAIDEPEKQPDLLMTKFVGRLRQSDWDNFLADSSILKSLTLVITGIGPVDARVVLGRFC